MDVVFVDMVEDLSIILAALTGGAGGALLAIQRHKRIEQQRAVFEEEAAQDHDVLAGLALLRRTSGTTRDTPGRD